MPKRPRGEKRPPDRVGQAVPVAGTDTGEIDHSTPEEDALDKADRASALKSETIREVIVLARR